MKRKSLLKALVASMAFAVSVWTGMAEADEGFDTLAGIPAETISREEMAAVEGQFFINPLLSILRSLSLPFIGQLPIPTLPTIPGLPTLPTIPGVPTLPTIPGLPILPTLPGIPGLPF